MRRFLSPFTGAFLIACLVLATSVAGYYRAAHEIALAGQSTLIICGKNGASTITLDRNGSPIETPDNSCAHCGDCANLSVTTLPVMALSVHSANRGRPFARPVTTPNPILRLVARPPRAPPGKAIF